MVDPDQVVVDVLAAAGLGLVAPPTANANLFRGPVRAAAAGVPVKAVFAEAQGGARNSRFMGTGSKDRELAVTIRVRSEVGDSAGGRTLASQVHGALDHVTAGLPAGYVDARCDQPFPIPLGQGELGAHEWSVNVTLRFTGA